MKVIVKETGELIEVKRKGTKGVHAIFGDVKSYRTYYGDDLVFYRYTPEYFEILKNVIQGVAGNPSMSSLSKTELASHCIELADEMMCELFKSKQMRCHEEEVPIEEDFNPWDDKERAV